MPNLALGLKHSESDTCALERMKVHVYYRKHVDAKVPQGLLKASLKRLYQGTMSWVGLRRKEGAVKKEKGEKRSPWLRVRRRD